MRAVSLWTGPPLPEFEDEPVVVHARSRWLGLLAVALESLAQLHLDAGNPQAVLLLVEPRLAEFPLRERLHSHAALALYRCGRQTEALRVIDRTRQMCWSPRASTSARTSAASSTGSSPRTPSCWPWPSCRTDGPGRTVS